MDDDGNPIVPTTEEIERARVIADRLDEQKLVIVGRRCLIECVSEWLIRCAHRPRVWCAIPRYLCDDSAISQVLRRSTRSLTSPPRRPSSFATSLTRISPSLSPSRCSRSSLVRTLLRTISPSPSPSPSVPLTQTTDHTRNSTFNIYGTIATATLELWECENVTIVVRSSDAAAATTTAGC